MSESAYLEIDLTFTRADGDVSAFDDFLDCVVDELGQIGREADYVARARDLTVMFSVVTASTDDEEFIRALSDLRTALHAANCHTGDWPEMMHEIMAMRSSRARELQPA